MNIQYVAGDLLEASQTIIVHGCNCFHTMGSGVAKFIRQKFPEAFEADLKTEWGTKNKLGNYSYVIVNDKIIINAYTQFEYGTDSRKLNYDALVTVFEKICEDFSFYNEIAIPKIGCGLAGGDWNIVEAILNQIGKKFNKIFVVYVV